LAKEQAADTHLVQVAQAPEPGWRFEKEDDIFVLLEIEIQFSVYHSVV
jgi:hypothetical protein